MIFFFSMLQDNQISFIGDHAFQGLQKVQIL